MEEDENIQNIEMVTDLKLKQRIRDENRRVEGRNTKGEIKFSKREGSGHRLGCTQKRTLTGEKGEKEKF